MARTVTDMAKLLDAMVGYDAEDPWSRELYSEAAKLPERFTFALPDHLEFYGDAHAMHAFNEAVDRLEGLGGKPLSALSIVGFPDALPTAVLGEILNGAAAVAAEAGIAIVGGHTIKSEEPIFGLAVVDTHFPKQSFRVGVFFDGR